MANENDIEIRVVVDDAQATAKLTALDGTVQDVKLSAESASGGFSRFEAAIVTVSSAINIAQTAFAAVSGSVGALFAALERGSAIDDVASAFESLTAKAGGTADVFLNELQSATAGTISQFELMQKANVSLQSGIKPDQYIELAKAARVLAEETGGNLTEELGKLERAFATGQDRLLKNRLGIIDLEAAESSLAAQLGITREQLTEEQKTIAGRNAIIDAAKKKTEEFGKVEADAGDAIARVGVVLADYRDKLLKTIGTMPSLVKLIELLAKQLERLAPLIDLVVSGFEALDKIITRSIEIQTTLIEKLGGVVTVLKNATSALPPVQLGLAATERLFGLNADAATSTAEAMQNVTTQAEKTADILAGGGQSLDAALQKIDEDTKQITSATGIPAIAQATADAGKKITEVLESDAFDFEKALSGGFEGALRGLASNLLSGDFKGAIAAIGSSFSNALGSSLDALFKDGSLFGSLAGSIGGTAAGVLGPIVGSVAGPAISGIVDSIISDIQSGDYASAISSSLDTIFPGVGSLAEGVVDSLFGGGDSAGTEAKKSADKFFADLLDANRVSVVINGQLQEISDLVFSGNQGGVGLFAGLEESAQSAFRGVGTAFEGLLGIAGDLGVDIGNVFANNLGGSLNNLQILVGRLGFSFEQLRDQVVKAFLDGKLSAAQAAESLRGIEQIAQKGIPDALGAVDQAFQNLFDSGVNGGAALVDALGDIGAEAQELSLTSIQEVQAMLTATGKFTEEQISQVFAALAANGIDSIDELSNVTAEQAIQIVAALQSAGVAFNDTGSAVTNIAEELNNIPSEIRTTVRVRFVAEGDSSAAAAVGQETGTKEFVSGAGEGTSTTSSSFSGSRGPSNFGTRA